MRRTLPDGIELDDDKARVDVDAVHRYLCDESYWAAGRTRETVVRLLEDATRVVGVYDGDATIGFCRMSSDGFTFAFLFDVFVLPEYQGRGLGVELVREAVELGPHADLPWHLGTRDAHELYRRFGFGDPDVERQMFRPARSAPDRKRRDSR
ncbi:MAG: GNAT family N-acetyltransferase [Actinomycetota bacterium]